MGRGSGGAETGRIFSRVSRRGSQAQEAEREAEREPEREAEREPEVAGPGPAPAPAEEEVRGSAGRGGGAARHLRRSDASPPGDSDGEVRGGRSDGNAAAKIAADAPAATDGVGDLTVPGGEPFGRFLDRGLTGDRRPKDYSAPAISDHHADILDEDRRLLKELGYSRRQLSVGNMIELAVELQHEYVRRLVESRPGR